ncbi:MAG: MerR family transcriptional regulator [Acidobacteriaceae bacterium]
MRKTSQKSNGTPAPVAVPVIPDKLYFRIGDVAKLCGVEAYVLRFWESEFPQLKPNKSGTGQRLYRKRDVELALRIKRLLYADGYTIAGARQVFTAESREAKKLAQSELPLAKAKDSTPVSGRAAPLEKLRGELQEILGILSTPVKTEKRGQTSRTRFPGANRNDRGLFDA